MLKKLDSWFDEMADPYKTDSQIRELLNAAHKYLGGYYIMLKNYADTNRCPVCGGQKASDSITEEGITVCTSCGCSVYEEAWNNRHWWEHV